MTTFSRKGALTAITVLIRSTALAACGGSGLSATSEKAAKQTSTTDLTALVKSAKSEGTLTIYTALQTDR